MKTVNKTWKDIVRNYFMSPDEQAYLQYMGMTKPNYSWVKLEILNAKAEVNGPSENELKQDEQLAAIWAN